jgi:hypothetical protein
MFGITPDIGINSAQGVLAFNRWVNNTNGPELYFHKSNGAVGSHGAVATSSVLAYISFCASDGTTFREAARMEVTTEGAVSSTSAASRFGFSTAPAGSVSALEAFRINQSGAIYFQRIGTTATAANAFIDNGSSPVNNLLRSTSSLRYKSDISDVSADRMIAALDMRPIEYLSLGETDDKSVRFVGLGAEDVAQIDPALVSWDAEHRPDGVQYERVNLLRTEALKRRCSELEMRIAQLETKQ